MSSIHKPKHIRPYGSWQSPITSDLIVSETVALGQPRIDGGDIYWVEMRPSEGGRSVVVQRDLNGRTRDITPQPFNARTKVHEYGGGDYCVNECVVYFSNFLDQRLYYQTNQGEPIAITLEARKRYADAIFDRVRKRLICVQEDHSTANAEAVNTIVSLSLDRNAGSGKTLASGFDFYSSPRISPDGSKLTWLCWNHPNMPWDGSELWVGEFNANGNISNARQVAGSVDESIFQPEWSPDGSLYFISDRTGWWNLYRLAKSDQAEPVCPLEAEFGVPQWLFGFSTYGFRSAKEILCTYQIRGQSILATLDTRTGELDQIENKYTDISYIQVAGNQAVFRAGSPTEAAAIVRLDLETREMQILRRSNNLDIGSDYISIAEAIEFQTTDGQVAHAFFYRPNGGYAGPPDERPPLLVKSHGGPTAQATSAQSLSVQYWTSRGIAVLDVNYGGSSGYGRDYRKRLKDQWGIVDVDDCVNGALHLARAGEVDGERMMITGGSAGGYTTLCALTFRKTFKAGASHFGVSDAEALARDTHKFESRYLDGLIGPYPERRDNYYARSPINFTEKLSCPVIFFQGLEDKVVPPNQAEMMVQALREKKIPVAYVTFPGEQHGFRQAKNIKRALDAELYFYSRVFGFELADKVEPVEIENLA